MSRILRLYVIREILTPTLMALFTITLMLLVERIYQLVTLILQPGVEFIQVLLIFGSLLPALLIFAAPMAVLIGSIVGVGRMVLDREALAIRASGVNLLSIFMPALVLSVGVSLGILALSTDVIPRSLVSVADRTAKLSSALFSSIPPGRFVRSKDVNLDEIDFTLYFREHAESPLVMRGVVLHLPADEFSVGGDKKKKKSKDDDKKSPSTAATGLAAARDQPSTLTALTSPTAILPPGLEGEDGEELAEAILSRQRNDDMLMILAETGRFESRVTDVSDEEGNQRFSVLLRLSNGAIHRRSPDPAEPGYTVFRFDELVNHMVLDIPSGKAHKMKTNAELADSIETGVDEDNARRELASRRSMPFAFFVFTLIGIPLAITARPSGKSWGILLAIGCMLVYFVLMQMGLSMVKQEKPLGHLVAFSPNLLFLGLGLVLWMKTLRS